MAYRIKSFLRLCSSTPPGGVAKSTSSETMCESITSTLFLMETDSCKWISQGSQPGGSQANFVIGIDGGDGP